MSSIANWSYTSTCTITPQGTTNEWGDAVPGTPYQLMCSWRKGGDTKYVDDKGTEFTPALTVWTELINADTGAVMPAPSRGDTLTIGDASYPIKAVVEDDMSAFRAGLNDFTVVA